MGLYQKRGVKGSITVEAAIAGPIFLYGMLGFLYLIHIFSVQSAVQKVLIDTANTASLYGYFHEESQTTAGLQAAFYLHGDKSKLASPCIQGGAISLLRSSYEEQDIILVADYRIKIPVPLLNIKSFSISQTVKTRKFVGAKREGKDRGSTGGEETDFYVFIAETGSVYHLTESCTHLDLSIREISMGEVEVLRNEGGGRYKDCELCCRGSVNSTAVVYITDYGDRYHMQHDCSGLKRRVKRVLFSAVKNWKRCSRCGY